MARGRLYRHGQPMGVARSLLVPYGATLGYMVGEHKGVCAGTSTGARGWRRRLRGWQCCTRATMASATGCLRLSPAASPRSMSPSRCWTSSRLTLRYASCHAPLVVVPRASLYSKYLLLPWRHCACVGVLVVNCMCQSVLTIM